MINFYDKIPKNMKIDESHNPGFKKHGIKLPMRVGIVGSSGAGKTNLCLNLISQMNDTFDHIVLCAPRGDDEPLYDLLHKKIGDSMSIYRSLKELPEPSHWEDKGQTLVIFDDIIAEPEILQKKHVLPYFIYGRKVGISSIYISQNYFSIPKPIRAQFSYLMMKQVTDKKDIDLIFKTVADMQKELMRKVYNYCMQDKLAFMLIDFNTPDQNRRFRKNFNEFIRIHSD
jgi:hypothetical protein